MRAEIEAFVIKILEELVYKGSGAIFKQLMSMLTRIKEKKELTFLVTYFKQLYVNRDKIPRASQILFSLCEEDVNFYNEIVKEILTAKLEINSSYINLLLNTVITLPEKYMITKQQVDKYGFIDLEKEEKEGALQKLCNAEIYMPSSRKLNDFVGDKIK